MIIQYMRDIMIILIINIRIKSRIVKLNETPPPAG